jgi:hypothetical protein
LPCPCPVLFPRRAEEPVLLGYLFFQLPRLLPEFPDPHPRIVGTRLRPFQRVTDGGDLLHPLSQGGVLVLDPRLAHSRPPRPSRRFLLRGVLRPHRTLRPGRPCIRIHEGHRAENRPDSWQSSRQNVSSTHAPDTSSKRRHMSLYQRSVPRCVIYKGKAPEVYAHNFICVFSILC